MAFWSCCISSAHDRNGEDVISAFQSAETVAVVADAGWLGNVEVECASGAEASAMTSQRPFLKQVVTDFIRSVEAGRPLTLLRERADGSTVDRIDATLSLNPSHAELTITAPGGKVNIDILCLCDIYALARDGERVFPQRTLTDLTGDESQRLLKLYYETYSGKLRCLMFFSKAQPTQ
eukprot:CAMPEP_0176048234 /NCGR_PEP_ID=MMETSP0120_2-20121206/23958_1 /TAXON_ID=160619 /ORGANISM="Kryptoperidinium foliaceum, Strain CCMP 1326" /LENGTH=177 /DNA_ID=CAMNT_0017381649 /DNA_START=34 /DNA_END=567 /DNA_ORIENTATION=+